mgnify:CR=1 FL=1
MSIELILFITTNQVSAYSRDHNHIPIVSRLSFCIHSKKSVSIRSPNFYKSIIQENKNGHLFLSFYKRKKQEDLGAILYEKVGRQLCNSDSNREWTPMFTGSGTALRSVLNIPSHRLSYYYLL